MADDNKKILTVTEAINVAKSHLATLYADAKNVLVEEVELSDDDRFWLITLGYFFPDPDVLFQSIPPRLSRTYKIFKIDRDSGQVRSMRIRETSDV